MAVQYNEIQELLRSRADFHTRLNLMPYDGTPEIKERGDGKYLYVRKRVTGKQTSTYVGSYTEELYNLLLRNAREAREIRKSLRSIEKQLAAAGYSEDELPADVINNIAFARANMKINIYDQAVLEGVATSFPQTEEIIENGIVSGMTATDVQKILNLKHAWEFILDRDVVASREVRNAGQHGHDAEHAASRTADDRNPLIIKAARLDQLADEIRNDGDRRHRCNAKIHDYFPPINVCSRSSIR